MAAGKTVLLPKVLDDATMELRRYTGRASLCEGAYHIMEPIGEAFTAAGQIDIALIPGLAFDAQVCFDFQKVAEVPVDAHDVAVDRVV